MMAGETESFILETLRELVGVVNATKQQVADLDRRMYNGGGGDIPVLKKEVSEVKALARSTEQKLVKQRAYVAGYAAGVSGAITVVIFALKHFAGKLGLHF